ncbi:MarR family winged helix-turn-helix transcriptional regulator [Chryseobacterium sp. Mn2064]|uniref:MarR family winged helix-turn-helix transcriptional regulator n=1 Tax=Chryseobacterium sp. Mn2064 TaxID=3395263 RepID=UPI003BCBD834
MPQLFYFSKYAKGQCEGSNSDALHIIEYIYRHDSSTGKQIAKAFSISPPAISRQLKFLIENGLISEQQSQAHRRIFNLSVTDKGKFIVENSENFRETAAKQAGKVFNNTELVTLTSLLSKFIESYNKPID